MRVFVINQRKEPLMPTTPKKARLLLKEGKAKVVKSTPFTIQLLYATGEAKQPIVLGIDAGSKTVGLSAATAKEELYSAEVHLRNDISELISERRQYRRGRRYRKTRYRKPRFNNRRRKEGWLAPSIQQKVDSHIQVIGKVHQILPVSEIIVETASFDIQKILNPDIQGVEYQQGVQLDFWNVRKYVLWRDNHQCQGRKGCKNKILNVHHIESRKTGGDAPNNLITLCEGCHKDYHSGKLKLNLKRGQKFNDAAFVGIMRWNVYNTLKEIYLNVGLTYGYITKHRRINAGLEKAHRIDARCISSNINVKQADIWYNCKFVHKNNRSLHKANILKGGIRKSNKAPYKVKGFRLFDKVLYEGRSCFIFGRRTSGYFDIRTLDGEKVYASAKYSNLKLLEYVNTMLVERRKAG